jgi:hypothetical protein
MTPPRLHRWAGLSAIAAVAVFAVGNALWAFEQPEPGASGAELIGFYTDLSDRIAIGGWLSLISIAIFIVFAGAMRSVIIELEGDELLANVAFGGVLVGLAAGIGAEGLNMVAALRAGDGELSEPLAQALFETSYLFGTSGAGIGFGVAMLAIGAAALRTRALAPRWLAWIAVACGAAMLTPLWYDVLAEYAIGPSFVLLAVLGGLLLRGSALPAGRPATA